MCFVTKGEKLLVEKDITLEDCITIKVRPVCIHHPVPGRPPSQLGEGIRAGRVCAFGSASALKGGDKGHGCRGPDIMMELSKGVGGCKA